MNPRVSPTGFLQSDLAAKLKIDELWYELWNSVKKFNVYCIKIRSRRLKPFSHLPKAENGLVWQRFFGTATSNNGIAFNLSYVWKVL